MSSSAHKRRRISREPSREPSEEPETLVYELQSEDDSSDEDDGGFSSESDGADQSDPGSTSKPILTASAGEAYILGMARKVPTSNNRLSESFDTFTRQSYLKALPPDIEAVGQLDEAYSLRFNLWRIEAEQGFSLLFHGYGSKRALLNRFAQSTLASRGHVVIINGFMATLSITDVLTSMESLTFEGSVPTLVGVEGDRTELRAKVLARHYVQPNVRTLFLLVHNLDGPAFLQPKARTALALLAAQPHIHLLGSVDHVRAGLLFTAPLAARRPASAKASTVEDEDNITLGEDSLNDLGTPGYNFLHHHTPTYAPYTFETLFAGTPSALFPSSVFPSLASMHSGRATSTGRIQATLSVLASLNDNAKSVFKTLADRTPCRYPQLYTNCRDQFIANSPQHLEALLAEFKDHEIIVEGDEPPGGLQGTIDADAGEDDGFGQAAVKQGWIWITLSKAEIEAVLERMDG